MCTLVVDMVAWTTYCALSKENSMSRVKKWKTEIDYGNCARYICPYCNEESDWQSPHCPMCGKKLRTDEEDEEAKVVPFVSSIICA